MSYRVNLGRGCVFALLCLSVLCLACDEPPSVAVDTEPSGGEGGALSTDVGQGGADSGGQAPALLDQGLTDQALPPTPLDQGEADMGGAPLAGEEGGESLDPNEALEDWLSACALSPTPLVEGSGSLYEQGVAEALKLGGPLSRDALLPINPSGSDPSALSYLTLQGGRLERHALDGRLIWASEARGLTQIVGVFDLNGDGSLEVVTQGLRYVYVSDLSAGLTAWRSPEQLTPQGAEVSRLGLVRVFETADLVRLYLADSGCGSAGSGDGALFTFSGALSAPDWVPFYASNRYAGRCPSQHSYHEDLTGEGVMMVDGQGLHLFDAESGSKRLCGAVEGLPPQGNTYIATLEVSGRPAWLLTTPSELILVQEEPFDAERAPHCPSDSTSALLPIWRRPSPGLIRTALTLIDLEGDGALELFTTSRDERGWRTELLSVERGELIGSTYDQVVLGSLTVGAELPELLVAERSPTARDSDPQRVQLMTLDLDALNEPSPVLRFAPRWAEPLEGVTPFYQPPPASWSASHRMLAQLYDAGAPRLALKQLIGGAQERLLIVGLSGVEAQLDEGGPWRAMISSCALAGCERPDLITLAGREGLIRSYDLSLTPTTSEGVKRPTGATSLAWSGDRLIARSESGELSALSPPPSPSERWVTEWRAYIGRSSGALTPPVLSTSAERATLAVTPSSLDPLLVTWEGRRVSDGVLSWSHSLPRARWRPLGEAISARVDSGETYLFRHERMEGPEAVSELNESSCDQAWIYSDLSEDVSLSLPVASDDPRLFTQRPECPNRPMRPQVIHALNTSDGRCAWVAVIRATDDCYGPSGQAISFVEGSDEREPALFLTETSAVRRFNPTTGALISTQEIAESPVGQRRGGGRVTAVADGALRYGGNGPPELYPLISGEASAGETSWRVGQWEGLRDQSWIYRPALGDPMGAWVSVGTSLPLARLSAEGELTGLYKLQGAHSGQLNPISPLPLSEHLTRGEEVRRLSRDPDGDLVIGTLEGGHYVIQDRALPLSVRHFELLEAPLSGAIWADWDDDGRLERLLSHSGGEVLIYQHSDLEAPVGLWVAPCERPPVCEGDSEGAERAIEPLRRADALCYGWRPLEELSGAEVQLREEGGAELTGWVEAPLTGRGALRNLSLVQGVRYQLALRAWVDRPEGREVTDERLSQLVSFEDVTPPSVSLTELNQRGSLGEGDPALSLNVEASDDVTLSGWSVNIISSAGVRVRSLGRGSLSDQSFTTALSWDGTNANGERLPTGEYEVRASVVDGSGLSATMSLVVSVE